MKLSQELSKVFKEEIDKILEMEIDKKEKYPQESFDSCSARANAMLYNAFIRVEKILSLAIIEHREKYHGEEYTAEKEIVSFAMVEEDKEVSTRGWWKP